MPPGPPSPASIPRRRNTSSSGAPKRSATRLDMMPASTRTAPSRIAMLTVSSEAIADDYISARRNACRLWREMPLESNFIRALQLKDFASVIGAGDFQPQPFNDLPRHPHLHGAGFREL